MKRILLWSDTHLPYQHKPTVANLLKFVAAYKPDEVLFLGDLIDFKPVARWSKDTIWERGELMQKEADEAKKFLGEFREAYSGPANIVLGNHCERWNNYLTRYAPGLFGLDVLRLESVFHFDAFNVKVKPQPYQLGAGVIAIHGKKLTQVAAGSAMKELARHGKSIVQGHSHRLGIVYETKDRKRFGMECGWLGDIRKASYLEYEGVANWQMGFGLLTIDGSTVTPELIPVESNGSFLVHGKRYGA
jgi:predicted phosphodiesterase